MANKISVSKTFDSLIEMAKHYGVDENPFFVIAANQYQTQQKIIEKARKELVKSDSLLTQKTYVKGRENMSAHPLVKELPKLSDSANKTLSAMLDIIKTLGKEPREDEDDSFDELD